MSAAIRSPPDSNEGKFLRIYSLWILLNLLTSLVYFKTVVLSVIVFFDGSIYLFYILFKSFKQKRVPFGIIIPGTTFLLLSAGLMIFFEYLSSIEAIRNLSIFAYIFTYIYSWNLVTNAMGVAWFGGNPIAFISGVFLLFTVLAFYDFIYRIAKECFRSDLYKKVFIFMIALLAAGGAMGAWHNTFPREELILPSDLSNGEQVFEIDVGFPLFGFFELEILRIHGIDKAAWYDRDEHGPIVVRTTPDKIKRVNFGWAPIRPAPEKEWIVPNEPNESILLIMPEMLYYTFLLSGVWIPALLFALFYYAGHLRVNLLQKFPLAKHLPRIILIALLIATLFTSFPVTLRFEEGLPRAEYAGFLEKHEYFTPSWLQYTSYPEGGGTARSSRAEPVILPNEEMMEKHIGESQRYYNKIEDFILIHRIKVVYGRSPTFYAFYLWLLPNVSAWTMGYVYLLTILMVFVLVRIVNTYYNMKQGAWD